MALLSLTDLAKHFSISRSALVHYSRREDFPQALKYGGYNKAKKGWKPLYDVDQIEEFLDHYREMNAQRLIDHGSRLSLHRWYGETN